MADALRPIFKSGGGGVAAKKEKSQSMFITSFNLSDISMKVFLKRDRRKKSVTPGVKIKNEQMKKKS